MENLTDFKTASTGKTWFVAWSGNMNDMIAYGSSKLNVLTYPLKEDVSLAHFHAQANQLNLSGFRKVSIDVGYTPLYSVGSIIENDLVVARPMQFMPIEKVQVNLDHTNVETLPIREFCIGKKLRTNPDGTSQTLYEYSFPLIIFHESKVQVLRKGIEQDSPYDFIIIPCQEVFRFYFGSSDNLSQELYLGGLHDPINRIYDPHELTPKSQIAAGVVPYIYLRTRIPDTDAKIVSRIAYSEVGLKAAKSVYNSVQLARVNKLQINPDCKFPFDGQAELKICGMEILANGVENRFTGKKIFLAYNILTCSGPFPFADFEFDRENSNLSDPNVNGTLPDSNWNNNGNDWRNGGNPGLGSGVPKNYNSKKRRVTLTDGRFLNAPNAIKKKKAEQQTSGPGDNQIPTPEPVDYTVSPHSENEPLTGQVDIQTKNRKDPKDNGDEAEIKEVRTQDEYEAHFRQLLTIFEKTGRVTIEKFSSDNSDYVYFNPLAFSPLSDSYKWSSREFDRTLWAWTGERPALAVRITERSSNRSFMLMDWFKTKNEKSQTGGKILCLYHPNVSRLSSSLVKKVLNYCATNIRVWLTDEQLEKDDELKGFEYICASHYFKSGASTTFSCINDFLNRFQFQINSDKQ